MSMVFFFLTHSVVTATAFTDGLHKWWRQCDSVARLIGV